LHFPKPAEPLQKNRTGFSLALDITGVELIAPLHRVNHLLPVTRARFPKERH